MKIKELLMKKLGCTTWQQVEADCPKTSSYKALEEYFILFRGWKQSHGKKNVESNNNEIQNAFLSHIEWAKYERKMLKDKIEECLVDIEIEKRFLHKDNAYESIHYSVFCGDVVNMKKILPKKRYTLLIADVPYGFRLAGSTNDEVAYKYPQLDQILKDFADLTLVPLWRIVIFHNRDQRLSVTTALKSGCHATENYYWFKTNVTSMPGDRVISAVENFTVGYYDKFSKKKVRAHCNDRNLVNMLTYPAVTKKLRHVSGDTALVNPYQKPHRIINCLLDFFSDQGYWVLDLFSGTGTTTACALRKLRNCIALEKDEIQANFIKMRIQGIWELPDEDHEVGAKRIDNTERFEMISREPMEPIDKEPGELVDLYHCGVDKIRDSVEEAQEELALIEDNQSPEKLDYLLNILKQPNLLPFHVSFHTCQTLTVLFPGKPHMIQGAVDKDILILQIQLLTSHVSRSLLQNL